MKVATTISAELKLVPNDNDPNKSFIVAFSFVRTAKIPIIDKKIPKDDRDAYPVLTDGNSIFAVPIIGKNDLFVSKAEKNTVSVIFRRIKK